MKPAAEKPAGEKPAAAPARLRPGVYRLAADVTNPCGDGRCVDYFRRPLWKSGDRFLLTPDSEIPQLDHLKYLGYGGWRTLTLGGTRSRQADLIAALLPHLERESDSLRGVLLTHHVGGETVLEMLIQAGVLSLDEVVSILAERAETEGA